MKKESKKTVQLVSPRGFCSGVRSAVEIFEEAHKKYPGTVYVLNELVHNHRVGDDMRKKGAVFVSSLEKVPEGAVVMFGAHGVGRNEENTAAERNLTVIDAGCPRVKALHRKAAALDKSMELIIFGNPEHPEVRGVAGHAGTDKVFIVKSADGIKDLPEMNRPVLLCQTTRDHLEIEFFTAELKKRFPALQENGGVCDAVYRRQLAVEKLVPQIDAMIIAGSPHSSNANRMCDVARRMGKAAFLVDDVQKIPDLSPFRHLGLGAGASTPEECVSEILKKLEALGFESVV